MRPNITDEFIGALGQDWLYPAVFIDIQFATGPIHIWTGFEDRLYNSILYTAMGSIMDISTIEDGATVLARGITLTFSGLDPTLVPLILSEYQVGQPVTITAALMGGEGLADTPQGTVVAWSGKTDQPTFEIDADTATVTIACESSLMDLNTPVPYRWTNQDQQLFFPGDRGFDWVTTIQNVPLYWNQLANSDGNP